LDFGFGRIKYVKVVINGESKEITKQFNLLELLKEFSLPSERVAIELNREVVRRKDWEAILVNDADKIEIVHFVGGG
jgi:thiamine biosynthesis protein ThiS